MDRSAECMAARCVETAAPQKGAPRGKSAGGQCQLCQVLLCVPSPRQPGCNKLTQRAIGSGDRTALVSAFKRRTKLLANPSDTEGHLWAGGRSPHATTHAPIQPWRRGRCSCFQALPAAAARRRGCPGPLFLWRQHWVLFCSWAFQPHPAVPRTLSCVPDIAFFT